MSWNVNTLQSQLALELDRTTTAPTVDSTDWTARVAALDRANRDWAETDQWETLKKVHNGLISTATGNASYAMPADFRKLDSYVKIGGITDNLPVVDPSTNINYTDADNFVNLLGNEYTGYVMFVHSNNISSGASVGFTYYSQVTNLATVSSVSPCPDPTFLVQRALYYIYKAKEDGRFPEAKAESDRILARMLENESTLGRGYINRTIQTGSLVGGFRIGNDI